MVRPDPRQLEFPLVNTARTHKHPRRRVLSLHSVIKEEVPGPGGLLMRVTRARQYRLDCGHLVELPSKRCNPRSVGCKWCDLVPRRRTFPRRGVRGFRARSAAFLGRRVV